MTDPHKVIEEHYKSLNSVKSCIDKLKHANKKLSHCDTPVEEHDNIRARITELAAAQDSAFSRLKKAARAVDELFASARG